MVSNEFLAGMAEWRDKQPTYFDFFKGLNEEMRIQAVTLFCLHQNCDMRTVELLFRKYRQEYDYLLTDNPVPKLPSREVYRESLRETWSAEEKAHVGLYECPECTGPVRKLYTAFLASNPPQYIYRCYDCGMEEVYF